MSKCLTYLLALLLAFPIQAFGQMRVSREPEIILQIFNKIYQYELDEAEALLEKIPRNEITRDQYDLTRINLLWWYLISGDQTEDRESQLLELLDDVITRLGELPPEELSEEDIFTIVHAFAYKTRVHIWAQRYLKGAMPLKHTVNYLEQALENYPRFDKYAFLAGLYHYFSAVALEEHPIMRPFFSLAPKGKKELGYRLLNMCSEMDHRLLSTEASYFLMKINFQLREDYNSALKHINHLLEKYPQNLIYQFNKFVILVDAGRVAGATSQYMMLKKHCREMPHLSTNQRQHLIIEADQYLKKKRMKLYI